MNPILVAGGGALMLMTAGAALAMAGETTGANPLLEEWKGPHGGVPPFDKVQVAQLEPALERGMAEQLAEMDRIAADSAPPSFENTIATLERRAARWTASQPSTPSIPPR